MSGMLYSLAIEPLLQKLRDHLKGLVFPACNNPLELSAYADDGVIVNGKDDVDKLEKIVNDFKCFSSAKVNWGESEAFLVGNWSGDLPTLRRVGNMEMDLTLFLMDHKRFNFTGIPAFYQSLFKMWGLFKNRWMEPAISLYCL